MGHEDKVEQASIRVADLTIEQDSKTPDYASSLVKQTRVRRLFTESQLFAFSASYLTTWLGVGSTMYYAFLNGGPVAYLFNYVIVLVGALAQAASLGELASIQPVAGAQYYWTYRFSPPSCRRFLTWLQGWTTWVGYVAGLASLFNSNVIILEATISMNSPSYVTTGWKTFLLIGAYIVFCAVINLWFFRIVPWFELLTGVLNVVYFFVFLVTLWVMAPRNSVSFVMEKSVSSGWDNYFVSWNIGILSQVWLWIGFECIVHMSEETKHPKIAIPRGMFWSIFANGLVGLVMLFTFTICMPGNIEEVVDSDSPLVTILLHATGSKSIATALLAGQIIMGISCAMASFSSTTRLTWAWARDGGLPQYFGLVDGRHRVPIRAVALTTALVLLLALLNLGSGAYTALGAITSLAVIGCYVSYAIILAVALYARYSSAGFTPGKWNLGRAGPFVNAFGLLYTCWTLVFLPFPSMLPVTASNMNWSLPAYLSIMILAVTLWFMGARKTWAGPNQKIVDIVLRDS